MNRAQRRLTDIAQARFALSAVAYAFDLPLEELSQPTRGSQRAALARQTAMYLSHVAFEMSLARVADAFGRDRSTVSHACHLIEDRRDDDAFDALLGALEETLRGAPSAAARSRSGRAA